MARRDAALLLMGVAGAHRRSELTALTLAANIAPPGGQRRGAINALRRQDGDRIAHQLDTGSTPLRRGGERHVSRDTTCARDGLHGIPLDKAIYHRPFFRTVHRTGAIVDHPICGDTVAAMLRRRRLEPPGRTAWRTLAAVWFVTEAFRPALAYTP